MRTVIYDFDYKLNVVSKVLWIYRDTYMDHLEKTINFDKHLSSIPANKGKKCEIEYVDFIVFRF